jgi:Methyltransferase domain
VCAAIREIDIFARREWQMSLGERAAMEGLLAQLSPDLSLEIGTAEGGSLARIAAHSTEVHAVDLSRDLLVKQPPNATFHEGDSKVILPQLLAGFADEGRNVDFALVDGDHTREGVSADLTALLESPAVGRTVLLAHDSFNPDVRSGIEAVAPQDHPKVIGCDLDFLPGRMAKLKPFTDQLLGGFALIVVDQTAARRQRTVELGLWSLATTPILFWDSYETMRRTGPQVDRDAPRVRAAPRLPLDAANIERENLRRELAAMRSSWSWRLTAPLRALKRRIQRLAQRVRGSRAARGSS